MVRLWYNSINKKRLHCVLEHIVKPPQLSLIGVVKVDNSIVPQNYKTCTLCGKTYPSTADFYHRDKRGAFGLVARCKSCVAEIQRQYLKTEAGKETRKRYKQSEKGKQAAKKYRQGEAGKEAAKRQRKNLTTEQKQRRYLWQVEYSLTEKGAKIFKKSQEKYRKSQHGAKKRVQYFKGKAYKNISAKYRQSKNGKASRKAINAKYRTKKNNSGGSFVYNEFLELCNKYDNKCICCGNEGKLEADHIIPVSLGGSSDITNIQPLCRSCNASKGSRYIDYRRLHNG